MRIKEVQVPSRKQFISSSSQKSSAVRLLYRSLTKISQYVPRDVDHDGELVQTSIYNHVPF